MDEPDLAGVISSPRREDRGPGPAPVGGTGPGGGPDAGAGARLSIRPLEVGDYDFVIARLEAWWGGRHVSQSLPRLFFDHFHDTGLAAEADGHPVGFLAGFMSATAPDQAYIHFVGVDPNHRRAGVARAMYERFFELARERGRTTVRCLTSPVNRASIAYHQAMGFEIEPGNASLDGLHVHLDHDGPGQDRVLFIRTITGVEASGSD
jgi:ribosomal protein S18 acetylase RimI-like enzyme